MVMEVDSKIESSDKRLNSLVAATVVVLSVFMAVCNIKDGNIVQNMQMQKADEVDSWGEYQGTKLKFHVAEATLVQLRVQAAAAAPGPVADVIGKEMAAQQAIVEKQSKQAAEQLKKAQSYRPAIDALGKTDDQFDLSEAFVSIAIAVAAVSALVASFPLLFLAWVSGAIGIIMGLAGFLGWDIHPDWIIALLT
jgi:hypothetical protein